MKQTIGYIKYDYMITRDGLYLLLLVCGGLGMIFARVSSPLFATAYMLFAGTIFAGSSFNKTVSQTVQFTALVPGGVLQKVAGRYLWCLICIGSCLAFGGLGISVMRWAGFAHGEVELADLLVLLGVTLFILAFQNVLLYLLVPFLGVQLVGLFRMVPGFIMFFGIMNFADSPSFKRLMQDKMLFGLIVLGVGIFSMFLSAAASCLIVRNRDDE